MVVVAVVVSGDVGVGALQSHHRERAKKVWVSWNCCRATREMIVDAALTAVAALTAALAANVAAYSSLTEPETVGAVQPPDKASTVASTEDRRQLEWMEDKRQLETS